MEGNKFSLLLQDASGLGGCQVLASMLISLGALSNLYSNHIPYESVPRASIGKAISYAEFLSKGEVDLGQAVWLLIGKAETDTNMRVPLVFPCMQMGLLLLSNF